MVRMLNAMILLGYLSLGSTVGQAQTSNDQVLTKAKEALTESRNLVADIVNTDMEMIDGDGKSMGTMRIQERISGWADGEPVRKIVANSNPEHGAVARTRFRVIVDNHPDKGLKDGSTLERIDSAVYDGRPCSIFMVTGANGKVSFKSKIWIDEATGLPLKVIHTFRGIPMTKDLEHTITYGRRKEGEWVPVNAVVDATVGMLFQNIRVISKYQFLTWVKRPLQP